MDSFGAENQVVLDLAAQKSGSDTGKVLPSWFLEDLFFGASHPG